MIVLLLILLLSILESPNCLLLVLLLVLLVLLLVVSFRMSGISNRPSLFSLSFRSTSFSLRCTSSSFLATLSDLSWSFCVKTPKSLSLIMHLTSRITTARRGNLSKSSTLGLLSISLLSIHATALMSSSEKHWGKRWNLPSLIFTARAT